jgi:hypothetical protein
MKCSCTECQEQEKRIADSKNYDVNSLQEETEKKLPRPASEFTRGYNAGMHKARLHFFKIAFEEFKRFL